MAGGSGPEAGAPGRGGWGTEADGGREASLESPSDPERVQGAVTGRLGRRLLLLAEVDPITTTPGGSRKGPSSHSIREEGDAMPWAWRSSWTAVGRTSLPDTFLLEDARAVARNLLGSCLRSTVGGVVSEGVIVETEAYLGPEDPASHAAARIGRTPRNETMFGPPGLAYVYRSYGIHWCLNVVTGETGFPAAVLIRALDPVTGLDHMRARRGPKGPLCSGPGRLCQALGITGALDGHPLKDPPLELLAGWTVPAEAVAESGRVGVRNAADWPLRFYLRGHPEVSRGPHRPLG